MTDTYRNLLIGAGHSRRKLIEPLHYLPAANLPAHRAAPVVRDWRGQLETLDISRRCAPDIVWNLNIVPWCRRTADADITLPDDSYDEIHAYEVLEHLGRQGDYAAFFDTFEEMWRLLRPGGFVCATCPSRRSGWLWGDPGHTRAVLRESLVFLNQPQYGVQEGVTSMSDYRDVYRADFDIIMSQSNDTTHSFVLQAVKPSRWVAT